MLKEDALDYLWNLFRVKIILNDDVQANNLISLLYERELEFPDELESLLLLFWESLDVNYLMEALKMAIQRYFFDVEKHVVLVALLFKKEYLTINEAKDLLLMPGRSLSGVHPVIENAINTAWLINQDEDEGLSIFPEDVLFKNSLADVLLDFKY